MREVTGPIIATAWFCVQCSAHGLHQATGQFYKQFALTIAISTVISP